MSIWVSRLHNILIGALQKKKWYLRCFSVGYHKLYISGKFSNCEIPKNICCAVLLSPEKKEASKQKPTVCCCWHQINLVSNTYTNAKALHGVNQQASISQRASRFSCILIGYLFILPCSYSIKYVPSLIAFTAAKKRNIQIFQIPGTLFSLNA